LPQVISVLILPWLLLTLPFTGFAEQSTDSAGNFIAINLDEEVNFTITQQQLDYASSMGVDLIAFSDIEQIQELDISPFSILLQSNIRFPAGYQYITDRRQLMASLIQKYRETDQAFPGKIAAVEILRYPNENDNRFNRFASDLADSLSALMDTPLYFSSAKQQPEVLPGGIDFYSARINPASVPSRTSAAFTNYIPSENERESVIGLDRLFQAKQNLNSSIIQLPADWFFKILDRHPEYEVVFIEYLSGDVISFPLPAEPRLTPGINWGVLFLILLWISFIIHFKFQPVYKQALDRYFLYHSFFVIDVMEHRIRNSLPGIIVMIQHALLTGLFLYVSAEILISDLGIQALTYHFPPLFFMSGNPLLSLFIAGVAVALALQFISAGWIFLLNKKLIYFSQVLNLYSLPLHINLGVVTLLVVLNQTGTSNLLVLSLSILFAVVWFLSFNVAAIDSAAFLNEYKIMNVLLTVGIHTLLVVVVIWMFFYNPFLTDPIRLAISL
jgi:hypothetical protein